MRKAIQLRQRPKHAWKKRIDDRLEEAVQKYGVANWSLGIPALSVVLPANPRQLPDTSPVSSTRYNARRDTFDCTSTVAHGWQQKTPGCTWRWRGTGRAGWMWRTRCQGGRTTSAGTGGLSGKRRPVSGRRTTIAG